MVRLGGAASPTYIGVFRGLQAHFRRHGIELDWVLYSDYASLGCSVRQTRDRSGLECSSCLCEDKTSPPESLSGGGDEGTLIRRDGLPLLTPRPSRAATRK